MEPQDPRQKLAHLNKVSETIRKCSSIENAVKTALSNVRILLNVQVASIFLLSKDGILRREGINGVDKENKEIDNTWFPEEEYQPGQSFSGKAIPKPDSQRSYGEPLFSNNIAEEYPLIYGRKYIDKLGELRCGISVPLNGSNRTFGTLEVINKQNGYFSSEDIYWLTIIETYLSNFIVNTRRKKRLEAYQEMTAKLVELESNNKDFQLEEIYQFVANKLTENFTPYKACIIRIADPRDDLEIKGKSFPLTDDFWEGRKDGSIRKGSQIVRQVYETQKEVIIKKITDKEIEKFNNKDWIIKQQLKSFACLPLSVQKECVGTISVYTQYPHKFSDNYKSFLKNMAFLTAAITARVRLIQDLHKIRKERNEIREKQMNDSLLRAAEDISQGILHRYKNDLVQFSLFLENVEEKQFIINEQRKQIERKVEQIQSELNEIDEVKPVDINQEIKEAIESFLFGFSEVEIKVEFIPDDNIPIINIKPNRIKEIIINLLSNSEYAIRTSKNKSGKITIKTSINTSDVDYIQITIEDNGIGIPDEIRNKIFDRGFTTHKTEGGSGIGLFIISEILNTMGGRVYFESSQESTKFYTEIPLRRYLN